MNKPDWNWWTIFRTPKYLLDTDNYEASVKESLDNILKDILELEEGINNALNSQTL